MFILSHIFFKVEFPFKGKSFVQVLCLCVLVDYIYIFKCFVVFNFVAFGGQMSKM